MVKILETVGILSHFLIVIFLIIIGGMLITENIKGNNIFTNNQLLGLIIILYGLLKLLIRKDSNRKMKEKGEINE